MRHVTRLAATLLGLAAIAAAEARRPEPSPYPNGLPPHGIYECWPDDPSAGPIV